MKPIEIITFSAPSNGCGKTFLANKLKQDFTLQDIYVIQESFASSLKLILEPFLAILSNGSKSLFNSSKNDEFDVQYTNDLYDYSQRKASNAIHESVIDDVMRNRPEKLSGRALMLLWDKYQLAIDPNWSIRSTLERINNHVRYSIDSGYQGYKTYIIIDDLRKTSELDALKKQDQFWKRKSSVINYWVTTPEKQHLMENVEGFSAHIFLSDYVCINDMYTDRWEIMDTSVFLRKHIADLQVRLQEAKAHSNAIS